MGWIPSATILHLLYALNHMPIFEEVFAFKSGHDVMCRGLVECTSACYVPD